MSQPSLRIRFSQAADADKIRAFYASNTRAHVDQRKEEILNDRINKGAVFMVEDERGDLLAYLQSLADTKVPFPAADAAPAAAPAAEAPKK